jgi:hypothetical protein
VVVLENRQAVGVEPTRQACRPALEPGHACRCTCGWAGVTGRRLGAAFCVTMPDVQSFTECSVCLPESQDGGNPEPLFCVTLLLVLAGVTLRQQQETAAGRGQETAADTAGVVRSMLLSERGDAGQSWLSRRMQHTHSWWFSSSPSCSPPAWHWWVPKAGGVQSGHPPWRWAGVEYRHPLGTNSPAVTGPCL